METPAELREKARHYRAMVSKIIDERLVDVLNRLADEYETLAAQRENDSGSTDPDRAADP